MAAAPDSHERPSPLVGATALADRLVAGERPVLLDVRWTLAGADRDAYAAGHLPGAVFLDLDADLAGPPGSGGRHPLPDPAALQQTLRRSGIDDGAAVVVYDQHDSSAAARAWWLLRWAGLDDVAVLDGGYDGWLAAGHPVESGRGPRVAPGSVTVHPGGMPTVQADAVAALVSEAGSVLLDARAAARYRGEVEPVDPVPGHIPGAVNLPHTELVEPDGRFRPPEALAQALAAVGVRPGTPAAASCGSGVTACVLVLAGAVAGVELALYPGSYSQWCALDRLVEQGTVPLPIPPTGHQRERR
jgi:thiosulfate/3-mercaptopyruvate sulfurtransferase